MSEIPHNLEETFQNYVKYGIQPGRFTHAVLANDFIHAAMNADDLNRCILPEIARYVFNNLPDDCWGSYEMVKQHLEKFP